MFPFWILLELWVNEAVLTIGSIRRAKLQSKCQHQQTNTQLIYRLDALPVGQPTVSQYWMESQSTEGKVNTNMLSNKELCH